jgi:sugar phosphate isomerase/epimerase
LIGISSPAFCSVPFLQMAEQIAEHFELWEVLSEGENRLELIRDGVEYGRVSLGLTFQAHAPLSDVNIGSVYEPMRTAAVNEVRQTIELCRQLDIELMTFHPGFVRGVAFLDANKALEMTRQSVLEISRVAEEHSVVAALENLPSNVNATCTKASDLAKVVEGTSVALCFDMGHANISGEVDNMLALSTGFKNVHLHNNDGAWDQHNRIGDGTADLDRVIRVLRQSYVGSYVIESTGLEEGIESKTVLARLLS